MTEDDAGSAPARLARLEPRNQRRGLRLLRRSLDAQRQAAIRVDVAQSGEAIGDEAQALFAVAHVVPAVRLIAVEPLEQCCGIAPQGRLEFACTLPRQLQIPLRRQTRVHHHQIQCPLFVKQRPGREPLEQGIAVGGGQDFVQGIVAANPGTARGHGQQVQIMIAEGDRRCGAEGANSAQHRQRVRAAVDQVANEPEAIAIRAEAQGGEQRAEFGIAALYVADRVQRHQVPSR